ncbi:MAG: hypothetical protein HYT70_00055 [Candidatus Aenigmarchaeota archaeon]|nr:hypothetical protein [Candidatus Aenigmarchaeota archaeon]
MITYANRRLEHLRRGIESAARYLYSALGPDIRIDEQNKIVELEEKWFFANLTDTWFSLRGYKIRRN